VTAVLFLEAMALGLPVGLALGLVGGGGSILTVPILIGVFGLAPKAATSASLVIVALNATNALRGYFKDKLVQYRMALTLTMTGLLGSYLGTLLNHSISPHILTLAFVGLMVLIAVRMLRDSSPARANKTSLPASTSIFKTVLAGSLIGLTTGFFGVGGGFIIVPALLMLGLTMRQAVPTSLLVIALNSLVALGMRLLAGSEVPLEFALPMVLGGAAGSSLAVLIAPKFGNAGLSKIFAGLILVLAAYLGFSTLNT
jgi:uncharacterized protein